MAAVRRFLRQVGDDAKLLCQRSSQASRIASAMATIRNGPISAFFDPNLGGYTFPNSLAMYNAIGTYVRANYPSLMNRKGYIWRGEPS